MMATGEQQHVTAASHLIPLGATRWAVWRDVGLRSAGFPARGLAALTERNLVTQADGTDTAAYRDTFAAVTSRLSDVYREVAARPALREAVAWQNPAAVRNCLDAVAAGRQRPAVRRKIERKLAAYVQRYCLKNDTIGFFGPVGWATVHPGTDGLVAVPGPALLSARTTYFEFWAIDQVAQVIARMPGMADWLTPRLVTSHLVCDTEVRMTRRPAVTLSGQDSALLQLVDGRCMVGDLLAIVEDPQAAREALERLRDLGVLRIDLFDAAQARPEAALRDRVERVGDDAVRSAALELLDELDAARAELAGAAGDAARVLECSERLAETFQKITGEAATRHHGRTYAGRTLAYEDTVRDVDVRIGRAVIDVLSGPIASILDSAHWLVWHIADGYRSRLLDLHARQAARLGTTMVPLARLLGAAAADLTASRHEMPAVVAKSVAEFQRRWSEILRIPPGVRRHSVSPAALADAVTRYFPARDGVPWSAARHQSPDLMIAATGPSAVARGDFVVVLGELHLATNTLDNRVFVEQHPRPGALLAAAERDHGRRRVHAVLPKTSPFVTSRLTPPSALMSPAYTYWSWAGGVDSATPPGPVLPAAGMYVDRCDDDLVVRAPSTGDELDLLDVFGDMLSPAVVNAFTPLAPALHRPRVTVGKLVLTRESWRVPMEDVGWAFEKSEPDAYRAALRWKNRHGMPDRVFLSAPGEQKPIGIDFASPLLVSVLARTIRRTSDHAGSHITVTEMVPDLDELWLTDAQGERYTSELRFVMVRVDDREGKQ